MLNVFFNKVQNWYEVKKVLKCENPTQGLPNMPSPGVKRLNAICMPYNGTYENKNRYAREGSRNT
jgi:hypothetical protein